MLSLLASTTFNTTVFILLLELLDLITRIIAQAVLSRPRISSTKTNHEVHLNNNSGSRRTFLPRRRRRLWGGGRRRWCRCRNHGGYNEERRRHRRRR